MTRSTKLGSCLNLHHQSASFLSSSSILHRLLGYTSFDNAFTARSNHSSIPNIIRRKEEIRSKASRRINPSQTNLSIPLRSGARSFTSQSHIKQLVSRPTKTTYSHQPTKPTRASSNSWAVVIILSIISGGIIYIVSPINITNKRSNNPTSEPNPIDTAEGDIPNIIHLNIMTGESLPGRPGTLTPHEEEKLREFWIATLQVFGALDSNPNNATNTNGHVDPPSTTPSIARSETTEKDKPKKKRFGLLRSKKPKDDSESTPSTSASTPAPTTTEDDKYGQTKEFHDALATLTPDVLRATFWSMVKHDHPDALLLRFLRARKWDVEKALVMMVSTMRWRALDMKVDSDIMLHGELGALQDLESTDPAKKKLASDFLTQLRMGKSFLHGLDRDGRPMCYVRVRLHRQGEQSEESLERYTVFIIESARMVLAPPVDTACVVFDMTSFSMANMDYAPVKFMIKCFEANYPESLGVVLIHKAPWIFQGIWKIIRSWLDPVVASKVHFTNNAAEMAKFVPEEHILKDLGGQEDWTYEYLEPREGENAKLGDGEGRERLQEERRKVVGEFEAETVRWVNGDADADADGAEGDVKVKVKREELAQRLRKGYWDLDPYVRARSYYDRVGMINPGGRLSFYPAEEVAAKVGGLEVADDDVD